VKSFLRIMRRKMEKGSQKDGEEKSLWDEIRIKQANVISTK